MKPSASLSPVKTTSQKTVGKAAAESLHVAEIAALAASIHVSMLLLQHLSSRLTETNVNSWSPPNT